MNFLNLTKKSITVITTLGLMGLVYAYYFFVFVPHNVKSFHNKSFGTLSKISENINDKYSNLIKGANSISARVGTKFSGEKYAVNQNLYELEETNIKESDSLYRAILKLEPSNRKSDLLKKDDKSITSSPEVRNRITKLNERLEYLNKAYAQISTQIQLNGEEDPAVLYLQTVNERLSAYKVTARLLFKDEIIAKQPGYLVFNGSQIIEFVKKAVKFSISIHDFIAPLIKLERFDEFFIIKLEKEKEKIIYQSFDNRIKLSDLSSFLSDSSGIRSANSNQFISGEKEYKSFIHRMNFNGEEDWLLVGVVSMNNYTQAVKQIDSWVILYTSLLVIFIIIIMPMLKLVLMNGLERLHIGNVLMTGLSIVIGTPIIILAILVISFYQGHDDMILDGNLTTISENIETQFTEEVSSIHDQLLSFDSTLNTNKMAKDFLSGKAPHLPGTVLDHSIYPAYNEMFWTDGNGMQKLSFTAQNRFKISFNDALELIDLSDREYFQRVKTDDLWGQSPHRMFFIQSIVSWTTGLNEIAVSIPSQIKQFKAAAITSKFSSVIDAILPLGFSFSIINEEGEVLLHSEKDKNLQENLLDETNHNKILRSALYGQTSSHFSVNYFNKEHRMFIRPIKGMPLFLVTSFDHSLLKTQEVETWILALYYILISFTCVGFLILIIGLSNFEESNLKFRRFSFQWMKPCPSKQAIYRKLSFFNLFVGIIMFSFSEWVFTWNVDQLIAIMLTPAFVFALIYFRLDQRKKVISLSFWCILFSFLIWNIVSFSYYETTWLFLLYQLLIVLAYFIAIYQLPLTQWVKSNQYSYVLFLFSWLSASSILPVFYYYQEASQQESRIWVKHTMLDFSQQLVEKRDKLEKEINQQGNPSMVQEARYINAKMPGGNYLLDMTLDTLFSSQLVSASHYHDFLHHARPAFNDYIVQNRSLIFDENGDQNRVWKYGEDTVVNDIIETLDVNKIGLSYSGLKSNHDLVAQVSALSLGTLLAAPMLYLSLLFGIILFGISLFFIIRFAVRKIYAQDLRFEEQRMKIDEQLLSGILKSRKNIILVGLPHSGKTRLLHQVFKGKQKLEEINCIMVNHETNWALEMKNWSVDTECIVVLENFEYQIHDHKANTKKLRLLEQLFAADKKVIISTETHPLVITDLYHEEIKHAKLKDEDHAFAEDLEVWRHIFSSFIDVYKPLHDNFNVEDLWLKDNIIHRELRYGNYLLDIKPLIENELSNKKHKRESIILEIQNYAQSYYFSLWNSLSKEERYVIYDHAKDGFVNTKNERVIVGLLKKGLLIYEDENLQMMNRSFNNFVLETIKEEEALAMEKEERSKGKWSNVSAVLLIIVMGLVVLIALGQPGFFSNINAIMAAIVGVTGILIKVDGFFSIGKKLGG